MPFHPLKSRLVGGIVASVVIAAAPLSSATAQTGVAPASAWLPAPYATGPRLAAAQAAPPLSRAPGTDSTAPAASAAKPAAPAPTTPPPAVAAPDLNVNANPAAPENAAAPPSGQDFAFGGSQGLASGAGTFSSPGGYVDDAIPQTMFRLRYDAEDGINRFDRAGFMFGTWREGSFHTHALVGNGAIRGTFLDSKATGTQIFSNNMRDQILSGYMEYAFNKRLSVFLDVPFQFVHFGPNIEDNAADQTRGDQKQFPEHEVRNAKSDPIGAGDVQLGFKYAFIACEDNRYLTFQLRGYAPTGDPGMGLGTGHYSLEPGFLAYQRLTDRLVLQGELIDWIPIQAGIGAGSVITYGGGFGYDLIKRANFRFTPVVEVVGWTCLGGTEAVVGAIPGTVTPATKNGTPAADSINVNGAFVPDNHGFLEANGDTIINVKLGVRTYFGEHSDIYAGYGRPLTGSRWYDDIFRLEYRLRF
jgi:hypothetical protein